MKLNKIKNFSMDDIKIANQIRKITISQFKKSGNIVYETWPLLKLKTGEKILSMYFAGGNTHAWYLIFNNGRNYSKSVSPSMDGSNGKYLKEMADDWFRTAKQNGATETGLENVNLKEFWSWYEGTMVAQYRRMKGYND